MPKRYHVERHINAAPDRVWAILTNAAGYQDWNHSIVSIQGDMAIGSTVQLVSTLDPKRTFKLKVSAATAPSMMG